MSFTQVGVRVREMGSSPRGGAGAAAAPGTRDPNLLYDSIPGRLGRQWTQMERWDAPER